MNEERLRQALGTVIDPETGINIVDLGLVYGIEADAERVRVQMTMTTPACPVGAMLLEQATSALRAAVPEIADVAVELVWEPPWSPERMSERAKRQLGW